MATAWESLTYLSDQVRTELPPGVSIGYKGESLEYITSGRSIYFIFLLALSCVSRHGAQFESYIHPFVIMLTVPLSIAVPCSAFPYRSESEHLQPDRMIMLVGWQQERHPDRRIRQPAPGCGAPSRKRS